MSTTLAFFEPQSFLFLHTYAHTFFDLMGATLLVAVALGAYALLLGGVVFRLSAMLTSVIVATVVAGGVAQTHHASFTLYVGGAVGAALVCGWFLPRLTFAIFNGLVAGLVLRLLGIEIGGGEFAFEIFWAGFLLIALLSLPAHRFFSTTFSAAVGAFVLTFTLGGSWRGILGLDVSRLYEQRTIFAGGWATLMMIGIGFQLWLGPIDRDRLVATWLRLQTRLRKKKKPLAKKKGLAAPGQAKPATAPAAKVATPPPTAPKK